MHKANKTSLRGLWSLILLLALAFGSQAVAQFPQEPIELVAWASPGGGSDLMVRTFAQAGEEVFPVPLTVINKPGGGGAVGMAYVAEQPADGYTILGVTNNLVFTPLTQPDLEYDYTDFTPIGAFGIDPKIIVVREGGDFETIEDLVQAGTEEPGGVSFGLFGTGTDDHIVSYLLAQESGAEWTYVPFSGGGEQVAALLGGHIDAIVTEPGEVASQVEAGELKVLAAATDERLSGMPDVPTLVESGWDVSVPKWRGFVVAAGTPDDVVAELRDLAAQTVQTETFQNYLRDNLIEPVWLEGEEFGQLIAEQNEEFGRVLQELGVGAQ